MQFCRKVLCQPCSARVTSPEEDMEYKMGSCIGISHRQAKAEREKVHSSVGGGVTSAGKRSCGDAEQGVRKGGAEYKERLTSVTDPREMLMSPTLGLIPSIHLQRHCQSERQSSKGKVGEEAVGCPEWTGKD
ncbi:uncharacterized protein AKAME5_001883700 [Lates japonicus]|uniref:Uncharacterized protein n=1 Tax=Lates japonicus TaxID=270547 RepID=A0AAD3N7T5_LATJO|nr:uncharacterized protein AKAME5_001883700 [Lates japonicus]